MNVIKKFFNFIKKESFYVILFVCLCVIATAAGITAKKSADNKKRAQQKVAENNYKVNENKPTNDMPNADLVKQDAASKVKANAEKEAQKADTTKQVTNTAQVAFAKPISNGTVTREYKETPVKVETLDAWCAMKGISIKANKGMAVLAAADGKVTAIGESPDNLIGYYVEITHSNGMKTVYYNLDPSVKVKVNDVVKQQQQIGVVGGTAISLKLDKIGQDLGFQVLDSKDNQVNPTKYVSFK